MKKINAIAIIFLFCIAIFLFLQNKEAPGYIKNITEGFGKQNDDSLKKMSKKNEVENRLVFRANFDKVIGEIEDGNIDWLLTNGGVVKYDKTKKEAKIFSVKDGLGGRYLSYTNFIKRGDYIWIATDFGISRLDVLKGIVKNYTAKPDDPWYDERTRPKYDTMEGLASNNNLKLFLDPYTNDLWTVSFNGISKYQDDKDDWTSYGKMESTNIWWVYNLAFNEDFVFGALAPTSYSGGIVAYDKKENKWSVLSEKNGFVLEKNANQELAAGDSNLWVTKFTPFKSCDDKSDAKIYKVLNYTKTKGWQSVDEVGKMIEKGEKIIEMNYSKSILQLLVRNFCDIKNQKVRAVKYDIKENKIVGVNDLENYDNEQMQRAKYAEDRYSQIIKEIEKIVQEPANKEIVMNIGNDLLIATTPDTHPMQQLDYKQFNSDFQEVSEANSSWSDLKDKAFDFLEKNNIQRSLIPLKCNQFNDISDDIYLTMGYGGPEDDSYEIIARYDKNKKNISELDNVKYNDRAGKEQSIWFNYDSVNDLFFCKGNRLLIFNNDGVIKYNTETKKGVFIDETSSGKNIKKLAIIGRKLYFLAEKDKMGVFDIDNLKYEYIDLGDVESIGLDMTKANLADVGSDNYYFYVSVADDKDTQEFMFVFDKNISKWGKRKIVKDGYINEIKFYNGIVWIVSREGYARNVIYVIDEDNNKRILGINNGIISPANNFFVTNNGLYISGSNGFWEFQ